MKRCIILMLILGLCTMPVIAEQKTPSSALIGRWSAHDKGELSSFDFVVDIDKCDEYWRFGGNFSIDAVFGRYTMKAVGRMEGAIGKSFDLFFETYETDHPYAPGIEHDRGYANVPDWYRGTWDIGYATLAFEGAIDFDALESPDQSDDWAEKLEKTWYNDEIGYGFYLEVYSNLSVSGYFLYTETNGDIKNYVVIDNDYSYIDISNGDIYLQYYPGEWSPNYDEQLEAKLKTYPTITWARLSPDGTSICTWPYGVKPGEEPYEFEFTYRA